MTGTTDDGREWPARATALLALEDGSVFWGRSAGSHGETFGELVFNTGMTGYQEVLTDPSYRGQIVVMTYPEIGIYGLNPADAESKQIQVSGFVVHRAVEQGFNQRATATLKDALYHGGTVAIEGIDTRAVTRRIRCQGAMRGAISTTDLTPERLLARVRESPGLVGRDLVREVTPPRPVHNAVEEGRHHVVLVDAGAKRGIERDLAQLGMAVSSVPYNAEPEAVLAMQPDAVLVSNGPGDPAALHRTIDLIRGLLERRVPVAGICLGHQLLALALGCCTYKMRFGHRGANHPVKDLTTGRVCITTHNHGFAVDPTSLNIPWAPLDGDFVPARPELLAEDQADSSHNGRTMTERLPSRPLVGESPLGFGGVEVTYLSLNDGTVEGLRLRDLPAFSVQFHPEASPGPHDARGFFDHFLALLEGISA